MGDYNIAIVIAPPGRMKQVLTDLLDSLFPYDTTIRSETTEYLGIALIYTKLSRKELEKFVNNFPIRNLIDIRFVILELKPDENILEIRRKISRVSRKNIEAYRVLIKNRGRRLSKRFINLLKNVIREYNLCCEGRERIYIENIGRRVFLTVSLFPKKISQ